MTRPTLFLCQTCETADAAMVGHLRRMLEESGIKADVQPSACMSGCARGPTLAVRQPGKMAYLFGEFGTGDMDGLIAFLHLFAETPDGDLADARAIGSLRTKALARIPPMSK